MRTLASSFPATERQCFSGVLCRVGERGSSKLDGSSTTGVFGCSSSGMIFTGGSSVSSFTSSAFGVQQQRVQGLRLGSPASPMSTRRTSFPGAGAFLQCAQLSDRPPAFRTLARCQKPRLFLAHHLPGCTDTDAAGRAQHKQMYPRMARQKSRILCMTSERCVNRWACILNEHRLGGEIGRTCSEP